MITPQDIESFLYCPLLKNKDLLFPPPSPFERLVARSIVLAEERACLKESIINVHKIRSQWDGLWWPEAVELGLGTQEIEEGTERAVRLFSSYSKYDFSSWGFPTLATEIEREIKLGGLGFSAEADIIKVDVSKANPCMVIINFGERKSLNSCNKNLIPSIVSYIFSTGKEKTINYYDISFGEKKIKIYPHVFRVEEKEKTRRMMEFIGKGINNKITYPNGFSCEECKQCKNFKF